jgi:hypothetical protein
MVWMIVQESPTQPGADYVTTEAIAGQQRQPCPATDQPVVDNASVSDGMLQSKLHKAPPKQKY